MLLFEVFILRHHGPPWPVDTPFEVMSAQYHAVGGMEQRGKGDIQSKTQGLLNLEALNRTTFGTGRSHLSQRLLTPKRSVGAPPPDETPRRCSAPTRHAVRTNLSVYGIGEETKTIMLYACIIRFCDAYTRRFGPARHQPEKDRYGSGRPCSWKPCPYGPACSTSITPFWCSTASPFAGR